MSSQPGLQTSGASAGQEKIVGRLVSAPVSHGSYVQVRAVISEIEPQRLKALVPMILTAAGPGKGQLIIEGILEHLDATMNYDVCGEVGAAAIFALGEEPMQQLDHLGRLGRIASKKAQARSSPRSDTSFRDAAGKLIAELNERLAPIKLRFTKISGVDAKAASEWASSNSYDATVDKFYDEFKRQAGKGLAAKLNSRAIKAIDECAKELADEVEGHSGGHGPVGTVMAWKRIELLMELSEMLGDERDLRMVVILNAFPELDRTLGPGGKKGERYEGPMHDVKVEDVIRVFAGHAKGITNEGELSEFAGVAMRMARCLINRPVEATALIRHPGAAPGGKPNKNL